MKKINKIKLSSLSNEDLEKREMNKLLGGETCCICSCGGYSTMAGTGYIMNDVGLVAPEGGYGSGSYG